MSIGNYITIALFLITLIISLVTARSTKQAKVQAKADRADVEKIVDKKIKQEMKPLEQDIREIKQTTHFLQTAVGKMESERENDKENRQSLTKLIETLRTESNDHFILILNKLDKKQDKK